MATDTRARVMAAIEEVMREAKAAGLSPYDAAEAAFPGVPQIVLGEIMAGIDSDEEEAWWQSVERTIDAEVIRKGIASAAPKPTEPSPANPRDDFEAELDPTIPF